MSDTIDDMKAFIQVNDSIFNIIRYSDDTNLTEARAILERIEKRQLYKYIGEFVTPDDVTEDREDYNSENRRVKHLITPL